MSRNKIKYGGSTDPSLNTNYCDGHVTQCQDFYGSCQAGGSTDPSLNTSYCDGHVTQCQDFYGSCQAGGGNDYYKEYKYYKNLYKKMKSRK